MISTLTNILIISSPSVLLGLSALITELSGVLAIFIEGFINLGAFLCFVFAFYTENFFWGIVFATLICTTLAILAAFFAEKTKANVFLVGVALNLFCTGIISVLSTALFETNGVLSKDLINPTSFFVRGGTSIICWIFAIFLFYILTFTKWGLTLKISGKSKDVLELNGISSKEIRFSAWAIAGFLAAFAGAVLTIRLQSFVPNISSGKGWIALAIVFLGRRKAFGVIIATLIFSGLEHLSSNLQGAIKIPNAVLLSIPYFVALFLFLFVKKEKNA